MGTQTLPCKGSRPGASYTPRWQNCLSEQCPDPHCWSCWAVGDACALSWPCCLAELFEELRSLDVFLAELYQ